MNGNPIINLGHLAQLVTTCTSDYLSFDCDYNETIVINRQQAAAGTHTGACGGTALTALAATCDTTWQKSGQHCCTVRANWVFALLVLGPDAVLPMLSLSLCCQCCKTTAYLLRCLRTYSRYSAPPGHHHCSRTRRAAGRMARATASTSRQQQARLMWPQPAVMLAAVETKASMGGVVCVMNAPAIKRSQQCTSQQLCSSAKINAWLKTVTAGMPQQAVCN